jgi:DNA-binding transcriptional LysR family regulator
MIAMRIAPDTRRAVVGAPPYFARRPKPSTPRDLTAHACINLRLPTQGGFYAWEFEQRGRELNARVEGPIAFNTPILTLEAALAGLGLAFLLEDYAREHIAEGRLIRVLADWCRPFPAITCIIPPSDSACPRSRCWWRLCAIAVPRGQCENLDIRNA